MSDEVVERLIKILELLFENVQTGMTEDEYWKVWQALQDVKRCLIKH